MRTRLKFTKQGYIKFVGHLDTIRMFQRAIRVARLPISYSQGFNPHAKVFFALPLSVGVGSCGEYMDMITDTEINVEEAVTTLNTILPEGIKVIEASVIKEGTPSLMSLVAAADYRITFEKNQLTPEQVEGAKQILDAPELVVLKKGKKKTKEVDIKPLIYQVHIQEEEEIVFEVRIAAGSMENLNVDLLLQSLLQVDLEGMAYRVERQELYARTEEGDLKPLSEIGVENA